MGWVGGVRPWIGCGKTFREDSRVGRYVTRVGLSASREESREAKLG